MLRRTSQLKLISVMMMRELVMIAMISYMSVFLGSFFAKKGTGREESNRNGRNRPGGRSRAREGKKKKVSFPYE